MRVCVCVNIYIYIYVHDCLASTVARWFHYGNKFWKIVRVRLKIVSLTALALTAFHTETIADSQWLK